MPPPPPPVRTARTSLVLRGVGFHSAVDDDDPIVWLIAAFLTRIPTWRSALHRGVPEATALWAVQWLVAHGVPEKDSWYNVGNCAFDYTPMDRAAKRGYLSVVQFLHEHSAHGCTEYAVEAAAANGDADMLQFLYDQRWELEGTVNAHGYQSGQNEWLRAASEGNLEELKRVHAVVTASASLQSTAHVKNAIRAVIAKGYVDVLQWLHEVAEVSPSCFLTAVFRAIDDGDVDAVRLVLAHRVLDSYECAIDYAAKQAQLEIVKLLRDRSADGCTSEAFEHAARHGSVEMLRLLCDYSGEHCTASAMDAAAAAGSLEVVRYLHEHRTEGCSTSALDQAAANGHLDVVKFLVEHRHEGCTTDAMDEAAANGHLEIVQFLHEHSTVGCTTDAMDQAAANGHVEVVKFLNGHRTEGFTKAALVDALSNAHVAVVRSLLEWRTDDDMLDHAAVATSIQYGRFEMLKCLHGSGLVELRPDDFLLAARHARIEFLYEHCGISDHEQHTTIVRQAIEEASKRGDINVLMWLDTKRQQGETLMSSAIEYACRWQHLEAAEYLLMHGHDGSSAGLMGLAASMGRLELVQCLQEQQQDGCNHGAIGMAVSADNIHIVRYLCDHRTCDHQIDPYISEACIGDRQFDTLVYLHERQLLELKPDDFVLAIQSANPLEMLEFLYDACVVPAPEERQRVLQAAIEEAAKLRAMTVLEYIDSKRLINEVFLASKAVEYAAKRGHLEIAEYLVTHDHNGCTGALMNLAVFRGELDTVRYLHETRGDGFNERALQLAERKGHDDVVTYIREHRGQVGQPDNRGNVCQCRYCADGNGARNDPTPVWGDGADY